MEDSQSLATESFSYSWLLDKRPPLEASIETNNINDNMASSNRFLQEVHNFNFDVPVVSESPVVLVHADEIFSDGFMMPVYHDDRSKLQASTSIPATPISTDRTNLSSRGLSSSNKSSPSSLLKKWRKTPYKIFQKCSGFLIPKCRDLRCSRKSTKVDDLNRKFWEVQSWRNSPEESPRESLAHSTFEWRVEFDVDCSMRKVKSLSHSPQASPVSIPLPDVNYDAESPIYEAILHCKRSIGNLSIGGSRNG